MITSARSEQCHRSCTSTVSLCATEAALSCGVPSPAVASADAAAGAGSGTADSAEHVADVFVRKTASTSRPHREVHQRTNGAATADSTQLAALWRSNKAGVLLATASRGARTPAIAKACRP